MTKRQSVRTDGRSPLARSATILVLLLTLPLSVQADNAAPKPTAKPAAEDECRGGDRRDCDDSPLGPLGLVWPWQDGGSGIYTFQVENDLFGSPNDGHFTNGVKLAWVSREHALPAWWFDVAPELPFLAQFGKARTSLAIGQNMYTPDDITVPTLIADDRPYGGWTYASVGLMVEEDESILDSLELTLGWIGPESFAADTQKTWHRWINTKQPEGWRHQLKNEPGVVLTYEKKARAWWGNEGGGPLEFDLTPHAGFSLGNVFTHASLGGTVRLGWGLRNDYGAPRIRPSLSGAGFFETDTNRWSFYVFAGTEGRIVARNIFLDGNTFVDSHSVDRKRFVADLQGGVVLSFRQFRISYTHIYRTQEFDGQDDPDRFGAISVSMKF